jgi:uncharacterized protein YndB with AHSA1/START domain
MDRISKNFKIIKSAKEKIYKAFTDEKALEFWLAPYEMTGKIHDFDLRVGGGYDMSLFYVKDKTSGKTSGNEDRFTAKFIELKPYDKIIQTINFQSDKDEFAEVLILEVFLEEAEQDCTKVTIIFKNIPIGVDPKDNEAGTAESLEKLASYIDHNQ